MVFATGAATLDRQMRHCATADRPGSRAPQTAVYNFIYVMPLGLIVVVFTITLGSHKLQEREGQSLKLLSGLMMLNLSLVLLVMPERLANVLVAVGVFILAILTAGLIILVDHRRMHRQVVTDVKPRPGVRTRDPNSD
jgi:hypothetical membrane protein